MPPFEVYIQPNAVRYVTPTHIINIMLLPGRDPEVMISDLDGNASSICCATLIAFTHDAIDRYSQSIRFTN